MWVCNFCSAKNKFPVEYLKKLSKEGGVVGFEELPEMKSGCIDVIPTADYTSRPPQVCKMISIYHYYCYRFTTKN